jgi:hypothetical protein
MAILYKRWLPLVMQSLKPYVSSEDISKGERWSHDISAELKTSSFGILCVTKENLTAPWLNFEAGALSNSVNNNRVSPLLFGIKKSELKGSPLLQFQATDSTQDEIKKLIESINQANTEQILDKALLDRAFDISWKELEKGMQEIEPKETATINNNVEDTKNIEPVNSMLEEILELARSQHKIVGSTASLFQNYQNRDSKSSLRAWGVATSRGQTHPIYEDLRSGWNALYKEVVQNTTNDDSYDSNRLKGLLSRVASIIGEIIRERAEIGLDTSIEGDISDILR